MENEIKKKQFLISYFLIIIIGVLLFLTYSEVNCLSENKSSINLSLAAVPMVRLERNLQETTVPTIDENRLIRIDYPKSIRAGESDSISLEFLPDPESRQKDGSEINGNTAADSTYQDVFQDFNIFVESRLEIPGMIIQPAALVSEPLLPGKKMKFYWNLVPTKAGVQEGTVWIYLRFIPKNGDAELRKAIIAQPIKIYAVSFYGIPFDLIRITGIFGLIVSLFLIYPWIVVLYKNAAAYLPGKNT